MIFSSYSRHVVCIETSHIWNWRPDVQMIYKWTGRGSYALFPLCRRLAQYWHFWCKEQHISPRRNVVWRWYSIDISRMMSVLKWATLVRCRQMSRWYMGIILCGMLLVAKLFNMVNHFGRHLLKDCKISAHCHIVGRWYSVAITGMLSA